MYTVFATFQLTHEKYWQITVVRYHLEADNKDITTKCENYQIYQISKEKALLTVL